MKVYTLGNGFVAEHLPYPKIIDKLDCNSTDIGDLLDHYEPDVIVNCIGKTGSPNVDQIESIKEEAIKINVALPILLANECIKRNIRMIHIGSGCINYGRSPNVKINYFSDGLGGNLPTYGEDAGWKEIDFSNPVSFYSKTKYACDLALNGLPGVSILRIRMPVSDKNISRNLISKLIKYDKVINIKNSMTLMPDLVKCIDWAIQNKIEGIYNVVNPEPTTAAEIMREYQKHVPEHKFSIITEKELDDLTIAKRSNCILDGSKLKNAGFTMTPTKEALEKCMFSYIDNMKKGK